MRRRPLRAAERAPLLAGLFREEIDRAYEEQLREGGILLLVHPRTPEDVANIRKIPDRHAARSIETKPDQPLS
jgi:hypothetical protein